MRLEDAAPIVQKISPLPVPPFLLNDDFYDTLADSPNLNAETQPTPSWTYSRRRPSGEHLPQAIAHRGYKAKHPENTMGAFRGAVEAKANAIETDIHLTKDDIVVLSHDATLERCFGINRRVIDCTWDYVSQQRTIAEPHEPMPRLLDLLEYLATPGLDNIWLLLDIKMDNSAEMVMKLIAKTISQVPPKGKPWSQRVLLGCWAIKYVPLCSKYLPDFPICHIGFSRSYARQFLPVPRASFNMLQQSLILPFFGRKFLREVKSNQRPIYAWTVNQDNLMKFSISRQIDGVITDNPKRFLEVCNEWESGQKEFRFTLKDWLWVLWINFMVFIFGSIFWWKYGSISAKRGRVKTKGTEDYKTN